MELPYGRGSPPRPPSRASPLAPRKLRSERVAELERNSAGEKDDDTKNFWRAVTKTMEGIRALDIPASQDPDVARRNAIDAGEKEGGQEGRSTKPSCRLLSRRPEFPVGSGAPSTTTARRRLSSPVSCSTRLQQRKRRIDTPSRTRRHSAWRRVGILSI